MTAMTDTRLLEIIETWGADAAGWPQDERAAAEAHLAVSPERFAAALADARALDQMFDSLPQPEMPRALTEAIIAAAPRPKASRGGLPRWFGLRTPWAPASGMAAAALGLFMGLTVAPAASADDEMNAEVQQLVVSALGFDTATYGVEDLE